MKKEGRKITALQKKIAKQTVGTSKGKKKDWDEKKSYHKRFKTGKIYTYGNEVCIRAFNSARQTFWMKNTTTLFLSIRTE